jgi:hypothetical protein
MNDPQWFKRDNFDDNDGHILTTYQSVIYPWGMIEIGPCPACTSPTRYVFTAEQAREVFRSMFGEDL